MKIEKYLYMITAALAMAIALTLGACSDAEVENGGKQQGLMPVLFSADNMDAGVTRASQAYMPNNSRFVCSMFFHAGASDSDDSPFAAPVSDVNMSTAWLKVDNEYGNAVYWNKLYSDVAQTNLDDYGFDPDAKCFYWQNRLKHIFLALTDNHQLKAGDGSENGTLKLFPDLTETYNDAYMKSYDLTRGSKNTMAEQPDPIRAITTMKPEGASSEANRVNLFFKHQFAQIQVNLKSSQDESAMITYAQIEKVELLGVSATGYVAYSILPDGTVPATTASPANVDDVFQMFDNSSVPTGYLKSFEAITFGTLHGIRITWHETEGESPVTHVVTFKALDNKHKNLESGMKYIYNLELRRSLIAQIKAEITPWVDDKTEHTTDGTIDTTDTNE